jgi:hypothetical protein
MLLKSLLTATLLVSSCMANAGIKLTIYDDGKSCPSNCDAHVVFISNLNGTKYAHDPHSSNQDIAKCQLNQECEICFDNEATECLITMYRGSGPGKDTFDLTPKFYEQWCAKSDIPTLLAKKCADLKRTASSLSDRVNCIKNPQHNQCLKQMLAATQSREADSILYNQCKLEGQKQYNKGKPSLDKRMHGCAYEYESTGGPNSKGLKWKKLLSGACRTDTFVGRDGLDCCSGNEFVDAALGRECRIFYPKLL